MLAEVFQAQHDAADGRPSVLPGIHCGRLAIFSAGQATLAPYCKPLQFEIFFCQKGQLSLTRTRQRQLTVTAQEILLLSDARSIVDVSVTAPLEGLMIVINAQNAHKSLAVLSQLVGHMAIDPQSVKRRMNEYEGCAVLHRSMWAHATFSTLDELLPEAQCSYGIWKSAELLFLLCSHSSLFENPLPQTTADTQLGALVMKVAAYMKQHLDEKLTITDLAHQFGLSQTALKTEFRRLSAALFFPDCH